jgi:hypothetical protein
MKRFAALVLLALLSLGSLAAADKSPRMTPEQNAKASRKADKKQAKMLRKANRKQAKAARKFAKADRKANKKANQNLHKRHSG